MYYYHYMSATPATSNQSGTIEYYFECVEGGGTTSGWISNSNYTAPAEAPAPGYWVATNSTYRVKTRDGLGNESDWSILWNTWSGPV